MAFHVSSFTLIADQLERETVSLPISGHLVVRSLPSLHRYAGPQPRFIARTDATEATVSDQSNGAANVTPVRTPFHMMSIEIGLGILIFFVAYGALACAKRPPAMPTWLRKVFRNVRLQPVLVVALALLGRGLLMPSLGIPEPHINDEFSYLLMADTFAHHRLTNPTPPSWEHFETFHVNMLPTYHSKYPIVQGLALAFGQVIFRQPWMGVYLSTAVLCGAICWALQAFLPAGWAFLGGLLAVARLATFGYWMNSYWGGSMAALGGALALGAVVRLFDPDNSERVRVALATVFAAALVVLATSRPYEGLAFALPLIAFFGIRMFQECRSALAPLLSSVLPVVVIGLCGVMSMGYYNMRTTGNPLLMPYLVNERAYSTSSPFLLQSSKTPPTYRHAEIEKYWIYQKELYQSHKSLSGIVGWQLENFAIDWWFYVGAALSVPVLLGFCICARQKRHRIAVYAAVATWVAFEISFYSTPHYVAAITVIVYLFAMQGFRYLWLAKRRVGPALVIAMCAATVLATLTRSSGAAVLYKSHAYGEVRGMVSHLIDEKPGKHIVLVSYQAGHVLFDEVVHNGADFNSEKVLWARSMGPSEDAELCKDYPDHAIWKVVTDDVGISLKQLDICHLAPAAEPAR